MFRINNYISFLIFLVIFVLTITFDSFKSISTNIETLITKNEQKELLERFNDFKISKKLLLYVPDLDIQSLNKIKEIENKLLLISELSLDDIKENPILKEYNKEYFLYKNIKNIDNLYTIDVNEKLKELKENILNSDFSYFINQSDPFSIFEQDSINNNFYIKNLHLAIKDKGYFSIFSIDNDINSIDLYEKLYTNIHNIIKDEKDIKTFSPIYYFVENQKIIKDDVNKIIYIATSILLLLYMLILRDLKLLINVVFTLSSSVLFALLVSSLLFEQLSIFVLVFGISISTVAIDYMFHHYVHNEYEDKFIFNKEVFLGMLTTITAFSIFSLVSFSLIKQLCIFTVLSLLFSYFQFAFVYQKINFTYKDINFFKIKTPSSISAKKILIFTIFILYLSITYMNFDSNLKNLDVGNQNLDNTQEFFNKHLVSYDMIPFLIKANTIDELIENSQILKNNLKNSIAPLSILISTNDFFKINKDFKISNIQNIKQNIEISSQELGFKDGFFSNSYIVAQKEPNYTIDYLQDMGFEVVKYNDYFMSYVNIPKNDINLLEDFDFLINISLKTMFEDELNHIKKELFMYGFLVIFVIISIMLLINPSNIYIYLSFLLFPLSMILSLTFIISLNILHIFIIFIILSISIDYGIYMSSHKKGININKAIIYSILTTFTGFSVLIFSDLNALFSIGLAATIGILSILFLLVFLKRTNIEPYNL